MGKRKTLREIKGFRGAIYRAEELGRHARFAGRALSNFIQFHWEANGSRPSVSAVVVGRNDDYMADFAARLRATIRWNARYFVDEVVFIEWNPPTDRELLSVSLAKEFPFLRAYVVPPKIHTEICENLKIPLLEYHAKNVGIRRAKTDWILSTNADAAVGLDVVNTMLHSELSPWTVWNTQRADIPWREHRQRGMNLWASLRYRRLSPYELHGTGEFCFASREVWHECRGFDEAMVRHRIGCDMRGTAQMMAHGAEVKCAGIVLHLSHPTSCSEGVRAHHGEFANVENLPYRNDENWGLGNRAEIEIAERVWQIK